MSKRFHEADDDVQRHTHKTNRRRDDIGSLEAWFRYLDPDHHRTRYVAGLIEDYVLPTMRDAVGGIIAPQVIFDTPNLRGTTTEYEGERNRNNYIDNLIRDEDNTVRKRKTEEETQMRRKFTGSHPHWLFTELVGTDGMPSSLKQTEKGNFNSAVTVRGGTVNVYKKEDNYIEIHSVGAFWRSVFHDSRGYLHKLLHPLLFLETLREMATLNITTPTGQTLVYDDFATAAELKQLVRSVVANAITPVAAAKGDKTTGGIAIQNAFAVTGALAAATQYSTENNLTAAPNDLVPTAMAIPVYTKCWTFENTSTHACNVRVFEYLMMNHTKTTIDEQWTEKLASENVHATTAAAIIAEGFEGITAACADKTQLTVGMNPKGLGPNFKQVCTAKFELKPGRGFKYYTKLQKRYITYAHIIDPDVELHTTMVKGYSKQLVFIFEPIMGSTSSTTVPYALQDFRIQCEAVTQAVGIFAFPAPRLKHVRGVYAAERTLWDDSIAAANQIDVNDAGEGEAYDASLGV